MDTLPPNRSIQAITANETTHPSNSHPPLAVGGRWVSMQVLWDRFGSVWGSAGPTPSWAGADASDDGGELLLALDGFDGPSLCIDLLRCQQPNPNPQTYVGY